MTTGGDHDPFFDNLSDIPDGSLAGTRSGWSEGVAAKSSILELPARLSSAAFSRSAAPSPPVENPSALSQFSLFVLISLFGFL